MRALWIAGGIALALGLALGQPARATANADCHATANAALAAFTHEHFRQMPAYFAPALAPSVSAGALKSAWAQLTTSLGAFAAAGGFAAHTVQGRAAFIAPLKFVNGSRALLVACDASGKLVAFRIVPAAAVAAPAPIKSQVAADGVRTEPLNVPSKYGPLRGALTLPVGAGPFPAVVLVAGSGPQDMDETHGPNHPLRDLADGLAKLGIASLRYDKRTFDYPSQTAANHALTVDDEVTDDVLAALHLVAQQKGVDPHRVFVLGHSLGAMLAPRIATRDPQLAGVIMLAAPARSMLTILAWQFRTLGKAEGASAAQIAALEHGISKERTLLAGANPQHPPAGMSTVVPHAPVPQSYQLSLHDYHQVAVAKSLAMPMLILQGGNDFQVSPTLDFDAWKAALAGKPNVTFHLFPGLSHLFMPGPTKSPADYTQPAHVDPAVIRLIANWIETRAAGR